MLYSMRASTLLIWLEHKYSLCRSTQTIRHHPDKRRHHNCARAALGADSSVVGPFRCCPRRSLQKKHSNSPMARAQKQRHLSAMSACRSLSRCPTQTRRIGASQRFPSSRAWGRTGDARSTPLGPTTRPSGRSSRVDGSSFDGSLWPGIFHDYAYDCCAVLLAFSC